jgi:hypothetical protein
MMDLSGLISRFRAFCELLAEPRHRDLACCGFFLGVAFVLVAAAVM